MMNNSSSLYDKFDCDVIFKALEPAAPPAMSSMGVSIYCTFMLVFTFFTATVNIIVIIAFFKFHFLRKRSNSYIVSLACADIGVAVVVMPLHMYESWNGGWDLPQWFCYFRNIADAGMCAISTFNLCVLAVDRYLAVCYPFFHMTISRLTTGILIAFCWVAPLTFWMMLFVNGWNAVGLEGYEFCLSQGACVFIQSEFIVYLADVLVFFLPGALLIFVYRQIFATAKRHARAIMDLNITEEVKKENKSFLKRTKAARTLGVVVSVFFICWTPFYIALLVDIITRFQSVPYLILQALAWLGYLNSMMNPFLYYIFSQEFKHAFRVLFHRKVSSDEMLTSFRD